MKNTTSNGNELRLKAEKLLEDRKSFKDSHRSEADNIKLIHELEVHQIELELQNEELMLAKQLAEEAKDKYTALYNSAPTGCFTLSNLGEILELNHCAAAMLGKKRANLIGGRFGFFVKDESKPPFNHFLNEVFTKKVSETCDVYILSDEGLTTFLHLTGIISNDGGSCILIAVDITIHRQTEEILRSTNYKLEFLMNSAHLAWWDMNLTTGNVEFNKRKVEVLGFSADQFKHYSDFTAIVHPDDQDRLMKAMQEHIDGKSAKYEVEYRVLTKSGDYKWFYDIASISKRNSYGQPVNVTGFALDITQRKLDEEVLLESRFRSLFDNASEGILVMTKDGKISRANKAFAEMHGYTLDELLNMNIKDLDVLGDKTFEINKEITDRLDNGEVVRFEVDHYHKDGHIFPISIGTSLINVAGEEFYQAYHIDITERKQFEAKISASEEKYRLLSENSTDGVALFEDNKVKYVSKGYLKMLGFDSTEIENISFEDIFSFIHKEDAKLIEEKIKIAHLLLQNKIRYSYRVIGKNGKHIWVEDSVDIEYDNSGNHLRTIIHSRNINEQKKAEESLRNSEMKYRLLIDSSNDVIFCVDINGAYQFTNQVFASTFGKTPDYFKGKTYWDIFPKEQADFRKELTDKVFSTKETQTSEIVVTLPERVLYFLAKASPIKDESGNLTLCLVVSRDITERKKAEEEIKLKNEQLESLNLEKDKLFSIIAHDLRSPFQAFLGLTDLLAHDAERLTVEQVKKFGVSMHQSASNLFELLQNLLEWAQLQKESTDFLPEKISLTDIIAKNIELLRGRSERKGIILSNLVIEPIIALADEQMISSTVLNLLSNAIKFTKHGGSITVSSKKIDNEMIEISVSDTGVGIPIKEVDKLFKLGEKTGQKGTEGELSTGLGLMLCKEFVEKNGGQLRVESEMGAGSTFYFTIPINGKIMVK